MSNLLGFLLLYLTNAQVPGYDVTWSDTFVFYDGYLAKPYSIRLFGSNYLMTCFEERNDTLFSGLCKTGNIDTINEQITFSADYAFEKEAATDPYEIQLRPVNTLGDYFIIAYTNSIASSRGNGIALMGTYNDDGSLTYGNPATFNNQENDQSHLIELESEGGYFVVCSSVGPNDEYETGCKIGQYNTDDLSITFADEYYNVTQDLRTDGMGVIRLDSTNFLMCYGRGFSKTGVCNVGSVVDQQANGIDAPILFTSDTSFDNTGGIDGVTIRRLDSNGDGITHVAVCYQTNENGACSVGELEQVGTTYLLRFIGKYEFSGEEISEPEMFTIPPGQIGNNDPILVVCYVGSSSSECEFGDYNEDNFEITWGEPSAPFNTQGTGRIDSVYLGGNTFIVCYMKFSGSTPYFNEGVCDFGAITNDAK